MRRGGKARGVLATRASPLRLAVYLSSFPPPASPPLVVLYCVVLLCCLVYRESSTPARRCFPSDGIHRRRNQQASFPTLASPTPPRIIEERNFFNKIKISWYAERKVKGIEFRSGRGKKTGSLNKSHFVVNFLLITSGTSLQKILFFFYLSGETIVSSDGCRFWRYFRDSSWSIADRHANRNWIFFRGGKCNS